MTRPLSVTLLASRLVAASVKASGMDWLFRVTVCVLVPRFPPLTLKSWSTMVSAGSARMSGWIAMGMFWLVVPGGKFRTPLESV